MHNKVVTGVAAALLASLAQISSAAPIKYDFIATNFSALFWGTSTPVASVSGSYTLDGSTLVSLELAIGSQQYTTANTAIDLKLSSSSYTLGGIVNGLDSLGGAVNDFIFLVRPGYYNEFTYSLNGVNDYFRSTNVSITSSASTVPLPSSLPLFLSAIIGTSVAARKRQSAKAVAG